MLTTEGGTTTCTECGRTWAAQFMAGQLSCPADDCPSNKEVMEVDVEREAAEMEFGELLTQYIGDEHMRFEGRQGVEALCQIASAIGYKDPSHFGQLTRKAVIGDLIDMLEDNPGMVEAVVEWLGDHGGYEQKAALIETIEEDGGH